MHRCCCCVRSFHVDSWECVRRTRAKFGVTNRIQNVLKEGRCFRSIDVFDCVDSTTYENQHQKHCACISPCFRRIWKNRGKNKTIILIHLMHNLKTMRILKAQWNPFSVSYIFPVPSLSPTLQLFLHAALLFYFWSVCQGTRIKQFLAKLKSPWFFGWLFVVVHQLLPLVLVFWWLLSQFRLICEEMNTHDYSRKPRLLLTFEAPSNVEPSILCVCMSVRVRILHITSKFRQHQFNRSDSFIFTLDTAFLLQMTCIKDYCYCLRG